MFISRLFNSLDNVLSVIPVTSFEICLNRFGFSDNANRIRTFHLPSIASTASFIDSIVLGQPALDNITFTLYITFYLDSAFQTGSNIIWKAKVIKFATSKENHGMTTDQKTSKIFNIILWFAQGILALTFVWAGFMKIFKPEELPFPWIKDHPNLAVITGIVDLLGGLGIVFPTLFRVQSKLTVFTAYGIIALMITASIFHISRGEAKVIGFNIFMLVTAIFVAWGRQKKH